MSGLPAMDWQVSEEVTQVGHFSVDPALPWFAGHFPGNPILPGVVQLAWVLAACHERFPGISPERFSAMSRIKFKRPVKPGAKLALRLRRDGTVVRFDFTEHGEISTQGQLDFAR